MKYITLRVGTARALVMTVTNRFSGKTAVFSAVMETATAFQNW